MRDVDNGADGNGDDSGGTSYCENSNNGGDGNGNDDGDAGNCEDSNDALTQCIPCNIDIGNSTNQRITFLKRSS